MRTKATTTGIMANSSHMVVIQSGKCGYSAIANGHLVLDYTIGDLIKKPISAKLITVDGLKKSIIVHTDFTEPQTVNGKRERYLGISTSKLMPVVNTYIPITGSQLPSFGYISVRYADGKSEFTKIHEGITVIIEILASVKNGA